METTMPKTIYDHLVDATGLKPRAGEATAAFAKRLANAVDKLGDDEWKAIPEEAQLWVNAATTAGDAGKAPPKLPGALGGDADTVEEASDEEVADEEELEEPEAVGVEEPTVEKNSAGTAVDPDVISKKSTKKDKPIKVAKQGKHVQTKKGTDKKKTSIKTGTAEKKKSDSVKIIAVAGKGTTGKKRGRMTLAEREKIEADAKAGKLPPAPDFSAETHKRFRGKLDEVVKLTKAGDVKGLQAYKIKPVSTSPKAIDRYRRLAITALSAR